MVGPPSSWSRDQEDGELAGSVVESSGRPPFVPRHAHLAPVPHSRKTSPGLKRMLSRPVLALDFSLPAD
jgi:hypothetical protein